MTRKKYKIKLEPWDFNKFKKYTYYLALTEDDKVLKVNCIIRQNDKQVLRCYFYNDLTNCQKNNEEGIRLINEQGYCLNELLKKDYIQLKNIPNYNVIRMGKGIHKLFQITGEYENVKKYVELV